MKNIAIVLGVMMAVTCNAQITTREVAEYKPKYIYDSLTNIPYPGVSAIKGQEVLILNSLGFSKYRTYTYNKTLSQSEIGNKYYKIIDCFIEEKKGQVLLQLSGKEHGDTIYHLLDDNTIDNPHFLVTGYYEKMKRSFLQKKFKLRFTEEYIDINTGAKKEYQEGAIFTCIDIVLIAKTNRPAYILQNENKDEIAVFFTGFEPTYHQNIISHFQALK